MSVRVPEHSGSVSKTLNFYITHFTIITPLFAFLKKATKKMHRPGFVNYLKFIRYDCPLEGTLGVFVSMVKQHIVFDCHCEAFKNYSG